MNNTETRPKCSEAILHVCINCGCLFEFPKDISEETCHICGIGKLNSHKDMHSAVEELKNYDKR